jgi:hypothetical protein
MIAEPDMAAIEQLRRLTSIEAFVAIVHRDLVGQSDRIDCVDARLEQIERCLEFRRI